VKFALMITACVVLLCFHQVRSHIFDNLANISLMSALQSNSAHTRQLYVKDLVKWLKLSIGTGQNGIASEKTDNVSMIRALYIAQYYRLHHRDIDALPWYIQAAQSELEANQFAAIRPVPLEFLELDGTILLDDFADLAQWHRTSNTNVTNIKVTASESMTEISFHSHAKTRDILGFAYSNTIPFPTAYHNRLAIRIRSVNGAYLSVETVESGKRYRKLNYSRLTADWQIIYLPITEDYLDSLTISFTEPDNLPYKQPQIHVWLDWIRLELTD